MAKSGNRSLNVMLGIVTTILVGWALYVGSGILQPLVIALLLAGILQPVINWLARYRIPPAVTVILLVTALFFGLVQLGLFLQQEIAAFVGREPPPTTTEAQELLADAPQGPDAPAGPPAVAAPEESTGWDQAVDNIGALLRNSALPEDVVVFTIRLLRDVDVEGMTAGLIGGGFGLSKSLMLVMIYMIFFFAEQAVFRKKILAIAASRREQAVRILDTITIGIQRYLGVKTLISAATGALCYAVLVSLDVAYAELFGLLTFALNYIPTFGSIIAGVFASGFTLATNQSLSEALIVASTYLAVNFFLGNYLEPKILGARLNLSPLVIVISVVVWSGLWGVVGAFLAVPITSSVQIILDSQPRTRPIAIMLSSGPPRDREERRRKPTRPRVPVNERI